MRYTVRYTGGGGTNLGRGSDIGSELLFWVLRWLASRTGAAAVRDIRFSGFSSQRGVPGREPSEEGGGDTGVRGAVWSSWSCVATLRRAEAGG